MKKIYFILLFLMITNFNIAGEKKVLVEILTNSHCPSCYSAHVSLDNYIQTANGKKINFIYYHMAFPYSSDALYQHNTGDAAAKNNFYGPHSATPKAYFNGNLVSNSYGNWVGSLDELVSEQSDFDIQLSGNFTDSEIIINADVTLLNDVSIPELTINYVVVEDLTYPGNNGISDHKNVMRKIVSPQGDIFLINLNETKNFSTTIEKRPQWNTDNVKVIVFVQNKQTKEVYQSELITYSQLNITNIYEDNSLPNKFSLEQNYPNPFNPSTTINYSIPAVGNQSSSLVQNVTLKVYDIIGREIATLVNSSQIAGNYNFTFDAADLSAGFYYYQLRVGNRTQTKKMILLK